MVGRRAATVALAIGASIAVTACGGTATKDSGSSSAAASGTGSAQARKLVHQLLQRPKQISVTEPIGKPVPSGKRIDFVNCGVTACVDIAHAAEAAGAVLGWHVKVVNATPDPKDVQAAFDQVVRDRPDGVLYSGVPVASFQGQLKKLREMHIPLVTASSTDPKTPGIVANVRDPSTNLLDGRLMAAFLAADSGGKGDIGFINLPAFPSFVQDYQGFQKGMARYCPDCTHEKLDVPITAIGKDAAQRIVSFVQRNPKMNYLMIVDDDLTLGLPAALKVAGLASQVKVVGNAPSASNLQLVNAGEEYATKPVPTIEMAWYMTDALARTFAGVKVPEAEYQKMPLMFWTKQNIQGRTKLFPLVADYRRQFERLWGK